MSTVWHSAMGDASRHAVVESFAKQLLLLETEFDGPDELSPPFLPHFPASLQALISMNVKHWLQSVPKVFGQNLEPQLPNETGLEEQSCP